MIDQLRNIWQRRDLLYYIVRLEMKAENKTKVLGFLWSLLDPLLLFFTYIILVSVIFQRGGSQYPVLLFTALISWMWFARSLTRSVTSVTTKVKIIQTVRFPLAILPLSGIAIEFFNWLFALIILLPMLFIYEAKFSLNILWLPVLLIIQLIITIGACFICAVLGTYLSDLRNIIQFGIRLAMYLTPVLYSVEDRLPERLTTLYMTANPFAGLMESYKSILIRGEPPSEYILVGAVVGIVVFFVGLWYFTRDEYKLVKAI